MNSHKDYSAEDDPRFTAYALGELEESEIAAVEERLRTDPQARSMIDEVRNAARLLESELSGEEAAELSEEQRRVIATAAAVQSRRDASGARVLRLLAWSGLASAAGVLVALGLSTWILKHEETSISGSARYGPSAALGERRARGIANSPAILPSSDASELSKLGYTGGESGVLGTPPEELDPVSLRDSEEGSNVDADGEFNTEAYDPIVENPFWLVRDQALSTFSIDVDTASYANLRRHLEGGQLPPPDAVRIEELVNYFTYSYAPPTGDQPFSLNIETAGCPWAPRHRLVRIGLMGQEIGDEGRKASNLVFLIDVSGSMNAPDKLPLLRGAMKLLVEQLDERDRVAIVVYAGAAGTVLPSTSAEDKWAIVDALDQLRAGGSTAGGAGIQLAYRVAAENFIEGGVNRVLLATDGDFNVGVSDDGSLVRLIEQKRETGVSLTVLGFGTGNLKDAKMEKLADKGNGNYAYIDGALEARKVLVEELGATLETIAKDVKIQVEFNPVEVEAYRLIGYENRLLAAQDFNDDSKDAGEIGAGHSVTALYEIVPAGLGLEVPGVDPLKYQSSAVPSGAAMSGETLTLKLRYKQPDGHTSRLIEFSAEDAGGTFQQAGEDLRFATAVAAFGMALRASKYVGDTGLDDVLRWARESRGDDVGGYRQQFVGLIRKAIAIGPR